jgi:GR25 family glycosyltransferase involved in LPS biosynthesis
MKRIIRNAPRTMIPVKTNQIIPAKNVPHVNAMKITTPPAPVKPSFKKSCNSNPINNYFDKIYCINLDKRKDRWKQCEKEFQKHSLEVERFPAVDGTKLTPRSDWMSKGRLGCAMSHLGVLNKMVQKNYKKVLILEDDVQLIDDFTNKIKEKLPFIPADFDVLYFGGNNPHILEDVNPHIKKISDVLTLHAYAVSINFVKFIIPKIQKLNDAVDCIYRNNTPNFNCYIFIPYLAHQRAGFSDIEERETDYSFVINECFVNK